MPHAPGEASVSSVDGLPASVTLHGRTRRVTRLLDAWRVGGRWWRGEPPSDHYRVELEGGATVRVRHQEDAWTLDAVDD